MPAILTYAVDFANGNLSPAVDVGAWGAMQGGSGPVAAGDAVGQTNDPRGLQLSLTRAPTSSAAVSNHVFVVPPMDRAVATLPLGSRLLLRVDFERPNAIATDAQSQPEPWAVAVIVKKESSPNGVVGGAMISVTCQFNRDTLGLNGVRLHAPRSQQRDQPSVLHGPLNYARYNPVGIASWFVSPAQFVLEQAYCGVQAAPTSMLSPNPNAPPNIGHSAGGGMLSISEVFGIVSQRDTTVYSHTALSSAAVWQVPFVIGALGVALITQSGVGQISVRLRRFTVWSWPPVQSFPTPTGAANPARPVLP